VRIDEATFVIFDVESTGLDPDKDEVVEVAAVATSLSNPLLGMWSSLVKPSIPIPPEVSAIHGITDDDVVGAQPWPEVLKQLHAFLAPLSPIAKVSHNFAFDSGFLHTRNGICTARLAQHLWSGAPNYKNNTLRFWRGLQPETFGIAAHRALGDSLVTTALLRDELTSPEFQALKIDDVEALIEYAETPILFDAWPFGKHKGQPIDAADWSYIRWCLEKMPDLSRDMRYTLELQLKGAA
jgi:DNA polymerase III epsilon subunit-like protein